MKNKFSKLTWIAYSFTFVLFLVSCHHMRIQMKEKIDIQGHRGCRGLYPENTIPAFKHAVDLGVHTLELDVVANKAGDVFVSHEPFFNHEIATAPNGQIITKETEKSHNMYPLSLEEIKRYDVGLKPHVRFPDQKKISVSKPTLSEMVTEIEAYTKSEKLVINYNIEIKREPQNDKVFHPEMKDFAEFVISELRNLAILNKTTVQCFDVETLQYIHKEHPDVDLVYLVMDRNGHKANVENLGFIPAVYSPYFELVDADMITFAHENGMKVIPWTVNEVDEMHEMIALGVDGIISDYPDRLIEVVGLKRLSK